MVGRTAIAVVLAAAVAAAEPPEQPAQDPLDLGLEEQVELRLVLIDVIVLDGAERTVPGLTREDFEIVVDGERRPIDTLDVACAEGPRDDAPAARSPSRRASAPSTAGRKIVFALDYLHLSQIERVDVLEQLRAMAEHGLADGDEVLLAALNGGLRIEQPFTADRARVAETLQRMQYDISLWQPTFEHLSERGFFAGLESLLNVLALVPGGKAVVLFSNSPARAEEHDLEFARLAASAASARCAIYPVHAKGLVARRRGCG